jgi:hypothetical protein
VLDTNIFDLNEEDVMIVNIQEATGVEEVLICKPGTAAHT